MTTIYLIRHAEADGNLYRRAHGWYDSVITDRGYRQIAALAKRFTSTHFDAVYSSDRRRTMTTALSVYKTHGLPLVTTPRVREIGIGVWEDHPWAELERTDGEQLERFNTDAAHWHVAGGEYLPDVRERMIGALREIAEAHPNGTAAVFSHGMAIRLTVGTLQGLSLHEIDGTGHAENTAVSRLEYENGAFRDDIYVVTLSAELSGSYNSAVLGKNLYEEENGTKNIHVVNSRGAATTQVLIARKLNEYASQGMPFEEVVDKIEEYTTSLRTYFVLETLEVLRKNGRLSRLSATIAGALNIKPVMIGTRDGVIQKAAQARGMKKALAKMVEHMGSEGRDLTRRQFVISHCNCYERAVYVKELIKKHLHAEDVDIVDTKGVSSLYACDGGIIVSY